MFQLDPTKTSEHYSEEMIVTIAQPFNFFGDVGDMTGTDGLDERHKMYRGDRWRVRFDFSFIPTDAVDSGLATPLTSATDGYTRCAACFDVKTEDGELEEGDDGIGACYYWKGSPAVGPIFDANFFGRVEATGSSGFKFLEEDINDWDTDSGYLGSTSTLSAGSAYFVSEPLSYGPNSKKNLGIRKGETYWKCYVGEQDTIDYETPFEQEISLDKFTTDKPRRIDTSCIEDAAIKMFVGVGLLLSTLFL